MHRRALTGIASAVVGLGAVLALLLVGGFTSPRESAQDEGWIAQRTKGSPDALVTVLEASDFQCPYCRRQAIETFPIIEKEYIATGKVRWIFIQFPLTEIHANALAAAEFSMCAARAGRFWPVHDLLFRYQEKWAPLKDPAPFLLSLADSAGISRDEVTPCLVRQEMRELIRGEAEGVAKAGIGGTPAVYIPGAGLLAPGAQPIEYYRAVFDTIWAERNAARPGPVAKPRP